MYSRATLSISPKADSPAYYFILNKLKKLKIFFLKQKTFLKTIKKENHTTQSGGDERLSVDKTKLTLTNGLSSANGIGEPPVLRENMPDVGRRDDAARNTLCCGQEREAVEGERRLVLLYRRFSLYEQKLTYFDVVQRIDCAANVVTKSFGKCSELERYNNEMTI